MVFDVSSHSNSPKYFNNFESGLNLTSDLVSLSVYAMGFRMRGGAICLAAPMPSARLHFAAWAAAFLMWNVVRSVVLARTFMWTAFFFFSSDLWICECLVTSSSQHCFCVEIPDCAVHACYNRRSEAGRMAKASVSLFFFFFCCFGAKDRATLDDSPPSCDEFTMKLSIMGLISTESVAPVSFQVETTGLEAFTSHFVTCLKHCAVLSAPLSAPV